MYADPSLQKVASAAFFDELAALLIESRSKLAAEILDAAHEEVLDAVGSEYVKQAASDDLEELIKVAFLTQLVKKFPALGMPAGQGLRHVGSAMKSGVQGVGSQMSTGARHALMPVADRLAKSQNRFVQGMGDTLRHKAEHAPMRAILNPVGTAAEMATASGGTLAARGLANRGAAMASAAPAGSMKGRLGAGMQRSFQSGGAGHTVLTKALPYASEIGGAVATAGMTGLPVGAAGVLGKGATLAGAGTAKALGASALADGITHAAHTALGHGAEDVVGTLKQNWLAKRVTPGHGISVPGIAH